MTLPQRLDGLEKYLNELPPIVKVEFRLNEYTLKLKNSSLEGALSNGKMYLIFNDFIPYRDLKLIFNYFDNGSIEVLAMSLEDKLGRILAQEIKDCGVEEFIADPKNLIGASEYVNTVLNKYNFKKIYEKYKKVLELEDKSCVNFEVKFIYRGD